MSHSPLSSHIVWVKKKIFPQDFVFTLEELKSPTVICSHILDKEVLFAKFSKTKYFTKIDMTKDHKHRRQQPSVQCFSSPHSQGRILIHFANKLTGTGQINIKIT